MLLFVLYKTLSYQRLNATFKLQLLQPFRQFEENTEIRMYNIEIYDITLASLHKIGSLIQGSVNYVGI